MLHLPTVTLYLLYGLVLLLFSRSGLRRLQRLRGQKAHGCGPIPQFSQLDRFLGFDIALSMARALKTHRFLLWLREMHARGPAKTFTVNFLGTRIIYTIEPENMKHMSAVNWKDFGVEPMRRLNKASMPFADMGVNTTDGHMWEFSRFLIKPYFVREAFTNTKRLEKHVDNLLKLIPKDDSTFDMQRLMQRWFLDTSTEFLYGESLSSLLYPERAEIAWAMTDVLRGLRLRLQMSKCLWLFRSQKWLDAVEAVHEFVDRHIDKVFKEMEAASREEAEQKKLGKLEQGKQQQDEDEAAASSTDEEGGRKHAADSKYLLWSMAGHMKEDKEGLRSQMLLLFVPNNDTTSIFISNVFWNLARRPDIYAKVREEVLSHGDGELTFEALRSMKYLNAVLNETHRLYPNGVTQVRMCLKDTTLPVGGGADGKSPIFVQRGDVVQVNKSVMHRDKDTWGPDAEEFRPERWEGLRPFWNFVPFGGGPRRCPAQMLVTVEASYVVARFAREFSRFENRDPNPYTPIMRVGPVNKNGVQIAITGR